MDMQALAMPGLRSSLHKSSLIGSGAVLITEKGLPHLKTWTNDLVPDIDNNPELL